MPDPTLLIPGFLKSDPTIRPIDGITTWIQSKMKVKKPSQHSRIMVIMSETGSGKSTALTVALLRIIRPQTLAIGEPFYVHPDTGITPGIICTQPRVLTAIETAKEVSGKPWNPDCELGETVGYHTNELSNKPRAGIIYATAGILAIQLRTLTDEQIMSKYKFIQIDEAHERQIECDLMLLLLRNFYRRNIGNPDLPFLLLTSATFDPIKYAQYFDTDENNTWYVVGRTFDINIVWPKQNSSNFIKDAAELAHKIATTHVNDPLNQSDILIFMPGGLEITQTKEILEKKPHTDYLILTIDSTEIKSMGNGFVLINEQPSKLPKNHHGITTRRKIVIASIVAETGLTIESLKYVIDCGWARSTEIYPLQGISGLMTLPAPQSRIQQRMGRVGRKFDGFFYPLYTKETFDLLTKQQLPNIITSGVGESLLSIIKEQQADKQLDGRRPIFSVNDMVNDLLDMPSLEDLAFNLEILRNYGFISHKAPLLDGTIGYGITDIGIICSKFNRMGLSGICTIMASFMKNVSLMNLITAISLNDLSKNIYLDPMGPRIFSSGENDVFIQKAKYLDEISAVDKKISFLEATLIFDYFVTYLAEQPYEVFGWCENNNFNYEVLIDLAKIRDLYIEEIIGAGLNPFHNDHLRFGDSEFGEFKKTIKVFNECIELGYRPYTVSLREDETYRSDRGLVVESIKIKKDKKMPTKIITNKFNMKRVTRENKETKKSENKYRIELSFIAEL